MYKTKPIPAKTKNTKPLSIGIQGGGQQVGLLVVGPAVGPVVGPEVGPLVGPLVGPEVGPLVGPAVGPEVGPAVGPDVGTPVGALLGSPVGAALGACERVGVSDGIPLGYGLSVGL